MAELGLLVKSLKNPTREEIEKFDLLKLRIRRVICAMFGFSVFVFLFFVVFAEIAFGKFASIDNFNFYKPQPKQKKTI